MAVPSKGWYGIDEGIVSSVPVRCSGGDYTVEENLPVEDFARAKIDITVGELREEREAVQKLGLV
jgi:malate dehydrogenase